MVSKGCPFIYFSLQLKIYRLADASRPFSFICFESVFQKVLQSFSNASRCSIESLPILSKKAFTSGTSALSFGTVELLLRHILAVLKREAKIYLEEKDVRLIRFRDMVFQFEGVRRVWKMDQETPLDELQWRSPEWIQMFGLRTDNVLEYFSQSPFFDRSSNNQVLKMQFQFNENFQNITSSMLQEELKKLKGVEFVVHQLQEPNFWIVRKQRRLGVDSTVPLADFYIIGSNVYMAPPAGAILKSRLLSSVLSLRNALGKLQEVPRFSPSTGHTYEIDQSTEFTSSRSKSQTSSKDATNTGTPLPDEAKIQPKMATVADTSVSNTIQPSAYTFRNLLQFSSFSQVSYLDDQPIATAAVNKELDRTKSQLGKGI